MEMDFEALVNALPIWREQAEEDALPRDYKLPHIDGDDGDE